MVSHLFSIFNTIPKCFHPLPVHIDVPFPVLSISWCFYFLIDAKAFHFIDSIRSKSFTIPFAILFTSTSSIQYRCHTQCSHIRKHISWTAKCLEIHRHRWDSNPRGQRPLVFETNSLTTRTQCRWLYMVQVVKNAAQGGHFYETVLLHSFCTYTMWNCF